MAIGDPYASLAQLKARLRIEDTADDAELTMALATATTDVDEYCKRQFNDSGAVTARQFHGTRRSLLIVDDFSDLGSLVVKTGSRSTGYTTTLTVDSHFYVGPEGGRINEQDFSIYWRLFATQGHCWPWGDETTVEVSAQWGWAAVPSAVVEATLMWAGRIFRRRDSPEGILNSFEGAPVRVGWMIDPDIAQSLRMFRKHKPGVFR